MLFEPLTGLVHLLLVLPLAPLLVRFASVTAGASTIHRLNSLLLPGIETLQLSIVLLLETAGNCFVQTLRLLLLLLLLLLPPTVLHTRGPSRTHAARATG